MIVMLSEVMDEYMTCLMMMLMVMLLFLVLLSLLFARVLNVPATLSNTGLCNLFLFRASF